MKLLRELNARLDGLIEFARGDQILKLMPKMSMPRDMGDGLEAVIRKKPEILAKYAEPGEIAELPGMIAAQRSEMVPQINILRRQRQLGRKLDAIHEHLKGLTNMSARLDGLIELGHGLRHNPNPLYDASVQTMPLKPRRLTGGVEQSIPLNRIISGQRTVRGRQVRSIKEKLRRSTLGPRATLPMVQKVGSKYLAHDGNHFLVGALRAGKRKARVLVQ